MEGNKNDVERLRDNVLNKPKRLMIFVGGRYDGKEVYSHEFVKDESKWKFSEFPYAMRNYEERRKRGDIVPCAELDDMPKVKGYLGPMFDMGILRYESQDAYAMFSM